MTQTANTKTQTSPRFQVAGKEAIYKLFDAFLKKTVIEDKAIDFSKPVVQNEDGTVEFADCDKSFSEIIGVTVRAPRAAESEQPVRGRNETDQAYAKRVGLWQKAQKKEQVQAKDFSLYNTALDNYLSGMDTSVAEEATAEKESAEDMKVTESKVNVKVKKTVDNQTVTQTEEKTVKTMIVSKEFKENLDLALAHYNWLWSLGMDSLWQGREFVKGNLQAIDTAIKDLVSKFVTEGGDEKNTRKVWQDKLKSVFLAQDYAKSGDCLILKEYFMEEDEKSRKRAEKASEDAGKPRKETLVTASKVAAKFEKDIAKCIEKKGYKDFLTKFRKKDIVLMNAIFYRFVSWPTRPEFNGLEDAKSALTDFVFKTRKDSDAPIRNGLLHHCNPDRYINIYTFKEKIAYVEHHKNLLYDYTESGEAKYNGEDSLYFSLKGITDGEFKDDYRANRTEEKICHIFDKLHAPVAV